MNSEAEKFKLEGNSHLKNHEFDEAIHSYEKAIAIDPLNAIYYSNKAQVELKIEQYGSAIIDCTKAIEVNPEFLKSYYRRALANYQLFKFKESKEDLKLILNKKEDTASRNLLKSVVKIERKIAFEKAIRVEHEDDDLFKIEKYLSSYLHDDHSDDYKGPNLEFKVVENDLEISNINDELIWKFVEWFKKGEKLNKKTLIVLLLKVFKILEDEPVYKEINQSKDEIFTIVGDVHGQFYDLINFFEKNGLVSNDHSYLFNGDFVDRGSWSCEVIILLYLLKVLYPNKIFLNRGNHETKDMNKLYGFEDECKYKYGENIFKMFQKSFKELSLITLLNNEYLIMHGGLLSNEELKLIDIKRDLKKYDNPKEGMEMELLWTDPQEELGYGMSKRGIGVQFGPDITKKFIQANGIKKVIRSHEVRMEGYSLEHDGNLITIFSAPNYCDSTGNKGALINVTYSDGFRMDFKQFDAVPHPPIKPMAYTNNGFM